MLTPATRFATVTFVSVMAFAAGCAHEAPRREAAGPLRAAYQPSPNSKRIADAFMASTGRHIDSRTYGGSRASLERMRRGLLDLAVVTSDASYLSFSGTGGEDDVPFEALRGIAVVNMHTLHLMVGGHSRAQSIQDLRGARVSLGPSESATALVSELLLDAYGLPIKDVHSERLASDEAAKRLTHGDLDAAFLPLVAPNPVAADLVLSGARLLNIEGPEVEHLRLEYPFLLRTTLPRGTYAGQEKSIRTIGVNLILVCRADMADEIVYGFLKAFFGDGAAQPTDLDRATSMSIPLHPAAAQYYRELELSR